MSQTIEGVGNEFVSVHVRALRHQHVVFSQLAYSVESSLSGTTGGRDPKRWMMGLEVAVQDGCFLQAADSGEEASHRFDEQPDDMPHPEVVDPCDGVATDLAGIRPT